MVRMDEIRESLHILEQLIDNIPEGDYAVKTKPIIRVPEGAYWASVEASRGEFGVYLESRGDKMPYRVKFRSTGLPLVNVVERKQDRRPDRHRRLARLRGTRYRQVITTKNPNACY